ncbi:MAG: hypothetical protein WBB85_08685 [Albidovulum sp.]|uniref:hypothetical protein n=1 Tax=Albidovulum sp. TaxID=1872424 RepID=UPI003CBE4A4D
MRDGTAIRWQHVWTDDLLDDFQKMVLGGYAAGEDNGHPVPVFGIIKFSAALLVCLVLALLIPLGFDRESIGWALGGFIGGYVLYAVLFDPVIDRLRARGAVNSARTSLQDEVTIDANGFRMANSFHSELIRWSGVKRMFHARTGLGIGFEDGRGLIVPDIYLPKDMDRQTLATRIAAWMDAA